MQVVWRKMKFTRPSKAVLAGVLVMLIVIAGFVVFKSFQKPNSIDVQRKADADKFIAAVDSYGDAYGKPWWLPSLVVVNDDIFAKERISGDFADPVTGKRYKIVTSDPVVGEIQYRLASTCGMGHSTVTGKEDQAAARVLLTNGKYYCTSS